MSRVKLLLTSLIGLLMGPAYSAYAGTMDTLNMPVGVTPISREVYGLHMAIFWVCVVIGILVFAVMFYSIYAHRKSKGAVAATFHESTTVEIIWTAVPFIILVVMAYPAAKVLMAMEDMSDSELTVKVTGYQWMWHYDYIDHDIDFFSRLHPEHNAARQLGSDADVYQLEHYLKDVDNALILPVGRKVRFLHTAHDVIHSWWVPDLSVKKDAIPGFINENWALIEKPGTYRGKCAELCGRDHGFMPIVVKALPAEEFDAWVSEQTAVTPSTAEGTTAGTESAATPAAPVEVSHDTLMSRGKNLYNNVCAACHQMDGSGMAGVFPAITGSAVATGDATAHIQLILNGVPGTAMAAYGAQMSDEDLAAVITYQRNALGNAVGDTVRPADIAAQRN